MTILISIAEQSLSVIATDKSTLLRASISSGKKGVGFMDGSEKTPWGNFRIAEKIGGGFPINTIFQTRKATGFHPGNLPENTDPSTDFILARILRLEGLDPENANTWDRYIYIHGTHQKELLGSPASHGCIRLSPEDMVELYELINVGDSCLIEL